MAKRTCSVDDCERPHDSHGYCQTHLKRLQRTGSLGGAVQTRRPLINRPCRVDGCVRFVDGGGAHDLCSMHYKRWLLRDGDVGQASPERRDDLDVTERFWTQVDRTGGPDACWPWFGPLSADGYGKCSGSRRGYPSSLAHRVAYIWTVGPIGDGLTLDHVCHSIDLTCLDVACAHRRCVNPAHLQPVTQAENVSRGNDAKRAMLRNGVTEVVL